MKFKVTKAQVRKSVQNAYYTFKLSKLLTLNLHYMLFDPKNKKKLKYVWTAVCVLIIASMVLSYLPTTFTQ